MSRRETPEAALPRIVILGGRGFVAGRLIQRLQEEKADCRPIGSQEVDLTDSSAAEKLRSLLQPKDAIVFCSALTPEHGRDRKTFMKNVQMAETLCALLPDLPLTQIVYISSCSVYDPRSTEVSESSPCDPGDLYGLSHLVRERLLREACQSGSQQFMILRPSAIYGASDRHNSYGPNRFLRSALNDRKISLFGQGEERRDHVYIDDVTRLILLCLKQRRTGILNAVSGRSLTFAQVARETIEAVGGVIRIESLPRRVPITHQQFDGSALKSAFPELLMTPLPEGIRQMITDLRGTPAAAPQRSR